MTEGPIKPGFASAEPDPEPDPGEEAARAGRAGRAHYAGMSDAEAQETWKAETLCVTCLCAGVCRVAAGAEAPLVVVSRCLAYISAAG